MMPLKGGCIIFGILLYQGFLLSVLSDHVLPEDDCPLGFCRINGSCLVPVETHTCENPDTDCNGKGDCITYGNNLRCVCYTNSSGLRCQHPFLPSYPKSCDEPMACLNNGTCVEDDRGCSCLCRPGFHGNRCEKFTRTYTYEPNVCENAGYTYRYGNYLGCVCPCGFYGRLCQLVWTLDMLTPSPVSDQSTIASLPVQEAERNKDCDTSQVEDPCLTHTCNSNQRCELDESCYATCISLNVNGGNTNNPEEPELRSNIYFIFIALAIIFIAVAFVCIVQKFRRKLPRDTPDNRYGHDGPVVVYHGDGRDDGRVDINFIPEVFPQLSPPPYEDVSGKLPSYEEAIRNDDRDIVQHI